MGGFCNTIDILNISSIYIIRAANVFTGFPKNLTLPKHVLKDPLFSFMKILHINEPNNSMYCFTYDNGMNLFPFSQLKLGGGCWI